MADPVGFAAKAPAMATGDAIATTLLTALLIGDMVVMRLGLSGPPFSFWPEYPA